jgi:chromosome segregation ATPase
MIDEDVIAAIDRVLSEGITLSLKSQHSVQGREVPKLDPNLPEQLLQELRDIAFKEDLVKKLREGLNPKVNFNAVKEKIYANADAFSSHQLERVGTVVDLLNNIVMTYEKLENLEKERDSAKKRTDQDIEALKETRQKILTSKISFTNYQIQLNSLDAELADFTAKLEKLKGDRTKIVEMQDQEKRKISSLNKEVKLIFRRLVDDQIKLKSVEDQILEAQTELESHEKLYRIFKAAPPF